MLVARKEDGFCGRVGHGYTSAAGTVSSFRVAGISQGWSSGTPSAITHPFCRVSCDMYAVDEGKVLFLKLNHTVRRVLALHGCGSLRDVAGVGLSRRNRNAWIILWRPQGYRSRSV